MTLLSRLYRRIFYGETAFRIGLLLGELITKKQNGGRNQSAPRAGRAP